MLKQHTSGNSAVLFVSPPSPKVSIKSTNVGDKDSLLNNLVYPESKVISQDTQNIHLSSSDDPRSVTNWYISKLKELNMNSNTNIQTNTNGLVVNQLVSSDNSRSIKVEVSNSQGRTDILIRVFNAII